MSCWSRVTARGSDESMVEQVVALSREPDGRRALHAAARSEDGVLDADGRVDAGALPPVGADARRAAHEVATTWAGLGVRVALRGDPAWPARLARVAAPPLLLAWRGPEALPDRPAVAIVGARRATPYGTGVAAWLADAAAAAGATVVSGGALGIDAAAHDAAAGAGTTVVLGCGHDVRYPRPHARVGGLFERVLAGGGAIVSELLPDAPPRPQHVRDRNRVVAGLADVVVIVEGGPTSGALVTAGAAADANIDVLAVPGDVRAPLSAAPHRLLAEGAGVCASPAQLLAALPGVQRVGDGPGDGGGGDDATVLPRPVHAVLAERWPRPVRSGDLAGLAGVTVGSAMAAVVRGRVAGEVVEGPDGVRLARAPGRAPGVIAGR